MALISRPSIPEVIFERIKSDLTEFSFNFFQDGIALDVSSRTYKLRLKASGVLALDKAATANSGGHVSFTLLNSEKTALSQSEYQLFLVEILADSIERTIVAGTLRWSVLAGKTTGLVSAADVSVNYISATQELMVALGVVDFGSSSSAASAAQALQTLGTITTLRDDINENASQVETARSQVEENTETTAANLVLAENAKVAAIAAKNAAEAASSASIAQYEDRGSYNAATNILATPGTLPAGLTANSNAQKAGSKEPMVTVEVGGALGFAGSNFVSGKTVAAGDRLFGKAGAWYFIPHSDLALGKVITLESKAVTTKTSSWDRQIVDINDWCTFATSFTRRAHHPPKEPVTTDDVDSTLAGYINSGKLIDNGFNYMIFATEDNNRWCPQATLKNGQHPPLIVDSPSLSNAVVDLINSGKLFNNGTDYLFFSVQDANQWAVHATLKSGQHPPVSTDDAVSAAVTAAPEVWVNHYPNLAAKLIRTLRKMAGAYNATADDEFILLLEGDSVSARQIYTSIKDVIAWANPPGLTTKNWAAYLWKSLRTGLEKPEFSRYDRPSFYTEVGTFDTLVDVANWDDAGDRPTETRSTATPSGTVAWTVASTRNRFNLIDRTSLTGVQLVTITCSLGAGTLEVKLPGTTVWVEAHGATFSQRNPASNNAQGRGNTIYQRRTRFRKVGSGLNAAVTVTLTKDSTTDPMYYWGIESMIGERPYVQLINVARGNHDQPQLNAYIQTDIYDRKPNFVIYQAPLLNEINSTVTVQDVVNHIHDFVYGDRAGATFANSLKTKSNNWVDFEVLIVLPHISNGRWNSDGTSRQMTNGFTDQQAWNAVKAFLLEKAEVPFIDMSSVFINYADAYFEGNNYNATAPSGATGSTLLNDATHANDLGTTLYAKHITPIFNINTL